MTSSDTADERALTAALAGLPKRLDRLFVAAQDGERFILSTDSARNIVEIVREWLRSRLPSDTALERDVSEMTGDENEQAWEFWNGRAMAAEATLHLIRQLEPGTQEYIDGAPIDAVAILGEVFRLARIAAPQVAENREGQS